MPFDSGVGAREKVEAPTEVFRGLSMIKYSDYDSFNLTAAGGSFQNNTGGHDWVMNWQFQGDTDCIIIEWLWLWEDSWGEQREEKAALEWYDRNGDLVSVSGSFPMGVWYCHDQRIDSTSHWITSSILNDAYDYEAKLATFTVSSGPVKFDIFFGYSGSYTRPSQAWAAGALQCLLGVKPGDTATQQSGIAMIFGLLTFQVIEGVPIYMGYLFSTFLWVLISVIVMALISRFIPFL